MEYRLEVVVLPVSDVDKAKDFYQGLGWRLDADFDRTPDFRVVQLTPPGSACSVIFGAGITSAAPGSAQGLQLDRRHRRGPGRPGQPRRRGQRGLPQHHRGVPPRRNPGPGRRTGPGPPELRLVRLVRRPRRQRLAVQEITTRLPGR